MQAGMHYTTDHFHPYMYMYVKMKVKLRRFASTQGGELWYVFAYVTLKETHFVMIIYNMI